MGFGKNNKGAIIREDLVQDLASLGAGVAIAIGTKLDINEPFRILKSELTCFLRDLPAGLGEGLHLGLANGDLSVADIKACIEISGPLSPQDRDKQEAAERFVKVISLFEPGDVASVSNGPFKNETGGPVLVVKPRWTFGEAESWQFFIYNAGEILTGSTDCVIRATHYGVWLQ